MTSSQSEIKLSKWFYLGVALLSFSLLSSQILLTRMLSVVFSYHFVFLIISVVMFGMTIGTLSVYGASKFFTSKLTHWHISLFSALSSLAIAFSFLSLYIMPRVFWELGWLGLNIPLTYVILSIPYIFIGIVLSLILTRFPNKIGTIYSVNLIGSAMGCLGIYILLNTFNAACVAIFISCVSLLSAILFALAHKPKKYFTYGCVLFFSLLASIFYINEQRDILKFLLVRGVPAEPTSIYYEKWNFFSNITLSQPSRKPFGWGYSPRIKDINVKTKELMIEIDRGAGTVITNFERQSDLEYLKYDISALAYYLRESNDVYIIGPGGGRDLLTAYLFGAKNIVGVEINKDIIELAYHRMAKFSKGINNYPEISIYEDDGRSFISRSRDKYDLIQASLIDSWAASASGAFALSENNLYTQEAWTIYLNHLKDDGMLTFSRFYHKKPLEIYRLITLAIESLQNLNIKDARKHIALAKVVTQSGKQTGTIIVSKAPFSDRDLNKLEDICRKLEYEIILSPRISKNKIIDEILKQQGGAYSIDGLEYSVDAPSDDKPFYFYHSYFKDIFLKHRPRSEVIVLRQALIILLLIGYVFIITPLKFTLKSRGLGKASLGMITYFAAIGMGFMLIEIGLAQRLGLYLGHPVYGLTTVFFALLLACGAGSYLSQFLFTRKKIIAVFFCLFASILYMSNILPLFIRASTSSPMYVKLLISVTSISLIGLLMGVFFPLGIAHARVEENAPLILYWGVNGLSSMYGSVLTTIFLIHFGFQMTILLGLAVYFIAFVSLIREV